MVIGRFIEGKWLLIGKNMEHLIACLCDNKQKTFPPEPERYGIRTVENISVGAGYIYCDTPISGGNKSTTVSYVYSKDDIANAMGLSIIVTPNPAKVYTEFTYTLPYGENQALLNIFDISGRLIEQLQLNSPIKKQAYNTSKLPAGSYTIEIKTSDYSYSTKLIVQ